MKVNSRTTGWARRYQTALRKYLEQSSEATLQLANGLGRDAVALGLETLAVTRIHAKALASVMSSIDSARSRNSMIKSARAFFAETVILIEKTHRAVKDADVLISKLNKTLKQRSKESVASRRCLKRSIAQRRAAEATLKKSKARHNRLLAESHCLIKHLRQLTHENLSMQEDNRKKLSYRLHDEINQGLLGIELRMLTLQKAVRTSAGKFKKEIGSTQRLVRESTRKVRLFADEFGITNQS